MGFSLERAAVVWTTLEIISGLYPPLVLNPLNQFKPHAVISYITDRFKAVPLIWFSVFVCFGVFFCTVSASMRLGLVTFK